jgi:hypothetical protein
MARALPVLILAMLMLSGCASDDTNDTEEIPESPSARAMPEATPTRANATEETSVGAQAHARSDSKSHGGCCRARATCRIAMTTAADETDITAAEALVVATLDACQTADEWLAALREYPEALGLTEFAELTDLDLQTACYGNGATAVCADAARQGRL